MKHPAPPAPALATALFGDRLELATRFCALLADAGVERGLIGPRETPRLWDRHLLNSAVLGDVVPPEARVVDLGSGAGLPGLALALARPDLQVTLVEPKLRRAAFLDEVVAELGVDQVHVIRARAEDLHGRERYDVVTSRALAPLDRLLGWSMPLVAPDGVMIAMKGSGIEAEIVAAAAALRGLGCADPEVVDLERPGLSTTRVVRVAHARPA